MLFLQRKRTGVENSYHCMGVPRTFGRHCMFYQFFCKESTLFTIQNTLLDTSRTNSSNIISRNLLMVIPLLANQDFTPMLNCHGTQ